MGLRDVMRLASRQRQAEEQLERAVVDLEDITQRALVMALRHSLRAEAIERETEATDVDLRGYEGHGDPREDD